MFLYKVLVYRHIFCLYALVPGDKASRKDYGIELFTCHLTNKNACLQEERGNFSNPWHAVAVKRPRLARLEEAQCPALLC